MDSTIGDVLIPSDSEYKRLYEYGYDTWHGLWVKAVATNLGRPPSCLDTVRLFPDHPAFPVDLELDQVGSGTARSTWSGFGCNVQPFHRQWDFQLITARAATVILSDKPSDAASSWFGQQAGHVTVLCLAWTYALSARWAELVSQANPLEYTNSQASWTTNKPIDITQSGGTGTSHMVLQLGPLTKDEARWWSAVLAPGQGWKASYPHPRWSLRSPWSITLDTSTVGITISSPNFHSSPSPSPAASFASTLCYIHNYCAFHSCFKESRAALAATLLLPLSRIEQRKIPLHVPRGAFPLSVNKARNRSSPSTTNKHDVEEIDRLLTLSTNWLGMRPILGSVFYDKSLYSNACGAWLQGTFAVLKGKQAIYNTPVLAQMLFDRNPNIAFLWLGAILTGAHWEFLKNPRLMMGMYHVNLHAAYWTNTLTSFIQEPALPVAAETKFISRANECRLMYITQEPPCHTPPALPYPPLGETSITDTDLGVQMHAHCAEPHELRFVSLVWRCQDGRKVTFTANPNSALFSNKRFPNGQRDANIEVDYTFMYRERDPSAQATGSIFLWMRDVNGYTVMEKEIRQHDWVPTFSDDDDDEDAPPDGKGGSNLEVNASVRVGKWMAKSNTDRYNSL